MLNVDTVNRYLAGEGLPPDKGYLLKDKGEGNFIARWDVSVREPTEEQLTKHAKDIRDEEPIRVWGERMSGTDRAIPRWAEDIIAALDEPTRARIAPTTLDKYKEKKALRGTKPGRTE